MPIECERRRAELLAVAFDDLTIDDAGGGLGDHLSACEACRGALRRWRAEAGVLRAALRPEPLAATSLARIRAALARGGLSPRRTGERWMRAAPLAAAAVLTLALILPLERMAAHRDVALTLSPADEEALVGAFAAIQWSGPVERAIELLDGEVERIDGQIGARGGVGGLLPWDAQDDWDLPTTDVEEPSTGDGRTVPDGASRRAEGASTPEGTQVLAAQVADHGPADQAIETSTRFTWRVVQGVAP